MFFWPPKENKIDESKEVVLIAKTTKKHYSDLELEVKKIHTYDVPCIIAIATAYVAQSYSHVPTRYRGRRIDCTSRSRG